MLFRLPNFAGGVSQCNLPRRLLGTLKVHMRNVLAAMRRWSAGRAASILAWFVPPLLCLAVYHKGLLAWFQADDFLWLGQRWQLQNGASVWRILFKPTIHGTWRPLSERGYFLALSLWFPDNPLPYRMVVFATHFFSLVLLAALVRRLTGSKTTGVLAAVFWALNPNLAGVMVWSSAYMQVLCGLCLLGAFYLLVLWVQEGNPRYYWLQWGVFLTGFLVMETNLVYPALAFTYALVYDRRRVRSILPMFVVSAAYVALHMLFVPKEAHGVYSVHLDLSVFSTLARYWEMAITPHAAPVFLTSRSSVAHAAYLTVFTAALLVPALAAWRRKEWMPIVLWSWFLFPLAPVLPLRDHVTDYYLTLPSIGIGMLAAWAVACAWRKGAATGWAASALALVFLTVSTLDATRRAAWWHSRSEECRQIITSVQTIRRAYPDKLIFLHGLTDQQFWRVFTDGGFAAFGLHNVYPTPEVRNNVMEHPEMFDVRTFFLPPEQVEAAVRNRQAVVFDFQTGVCRNITGLYSAILESRSGSGQRK